jgi:hypothetical protein
MMVTVPAVPLMPTVVVAVVIGLVVITAIVAGILRIVTVLVVARFYIYPMPAFDSVGIKTSNPMAARNRTNIFFIRFDLFK